MKNHIWFQIRTNKIYQRISKFNLGWYILTQRQPTILLCKSVNNYYVRLCHFEDISNNFKNEKNERNGYNVLL